MIPMMVLERNSNQESKHILPTNSPNATSRAMLKSVHARIQALAKKQTNGHPPKAGTIYVLRLPCLTVFHVGSNFWYGQRIRMSKLDIMKWYLPWLRICGRTKKKWLLEQKYLLDSKRCALQKQATCLCHHIPLLLNWLNMFQGMYVYTCVIMCIGACVKDR